MGANGLMSLSQIREAVRRRVQNCSDAAKGGIDEAITLAYDQIASEGDWPQLERHTELGLRKLDEPELATFETAEVLVPMPFGSSCIKSIHVTSPTYSEVVECTVAELARRFQASLDSYVGPPSWYAKVGVTAQYRSSPEGNLRVRATSIQNENTGKQVEILYKRSDAVQGVETRATLSGSFTQPGGIVLEDCAAGFPIVSIRLPPQWKGYLLVEYMEIDPETGEPDIPVEVARVSPEIFPNFGQTDAWAVYQTELIRIAPVPDEDYTAVIAWRRDPRPLVDDGDYPEIPVSTQIIYKAVDDLLLADRQYTGSQLYARKGREAGESKRKSSPAYQGGLRIRTGDILKSTGVRRRWR